MASQKSPKKKLKQAIPYIILFGVVLILLGIGFLVGRLTVPCDANDYVSSDTSSASETTIKPTIEPTQEETEPPVQWIEFKATAYCPCEKCCGYWATVRPTDENGKPIVYGATGTRLKQGTSVAADTSIYPIGTWLEIEGMGVYVVQDRGGAIVGNLIDIYFDNHEAAEDFGVQTLKVRIIK